jgi:hypothetical protein
LSRHRSGGSKKARGGANLPGNSVSSGHTQTKPKNPRKFSVEPADKKTANGFGGRHPRVRTIMYQGDDNLHTSVRTEQDRAEVAKLAARLVPAERRRLRRIARIREAVAASDYENSLKLSIAVDRLKLGQQS